METEYTQPQAGGTQLQEAKWYTPLTTVTTFSKTIAALVFIALPFIGFWYGMQYGRQAASTSVIVESQTTTTKADPTTQYNPVIQKFLSTLMFEVVTSSGSEDGMTFSILCSLKSLCYATYYDKTLSNLVSAPLLPSDLELTKFNILENTRDYVRLKVEELGYGRSSHQWQYIFAKEDSKLENILNCGEGCTKLGDDLFVEAKAGYYDMRILSFDSAFDIKTGVPVKTKTLYTLPTEDLNAGYLMTYQANGDPCGKCGKPDVTILSGNRAKIVLYRKTPEDAGGFYDWETKEVVVDLP